MHALLKQKLVAHSKLAAEDLRQIGLLSCEPRSYAPNQDIVRQGDKPDVSVVVVKGMVGRYQTLPNGRRQYISFHIAGEMPDAQSLFIEEMDHAVCAVGPADVGLIPHRELINLFEHRPAVGFAFWRETLIDASIFREAVVNNSARMPMPRMSHFFCEQYYRARAQSGQARIMLSTADAGHPGGYSWHVDRHNQSDVAETSPDWIRRPYRRSAGDDGLGSPHLSGGIQSRLSSHEQARFRGGARIAKTHDVGRLNSRASYRFRIDEEPCHSHVGHALANLYVACRLFRYTQGRNGCVLRNCTRTMTRSR